MPDKIDVKTTVVGPFDTDELPHDLRVAIDKQIEKLKGLVKIELDRTRSDCERHQELLATTFVKFFDLLHDLRETAPPGESRAVASVLRVAVCTLRDLVLHTLHRDSHNAALATELVGQETCAGLGDLFGKELRALLD